jgi:hypothetical protein
MSKFIKKKRSIPHGTSTDGLRKYFKPLSEISNQSLTSSVTESINVNNTQTDNPSELSLSLTSTTPSINNLPELSVDYDQMSLCRSFENICAINTNSILSAEHNQCVVTPQSHIDTQSSNTPEYDQSKCKIFSS